MAIDELNQLLRAILIDRIIKDEFENQSIQVINRIELKLNQLEALTVWSFSDRIAINQKIIKHWLAELNLRALKRIDLKYCNLACNLAPKLDSNLFHSSLYLEEIDLIGNNIDDLDSDMFSGLKNLKKLDLSSNSISILKEDIFKGMDNLRGLYLSYNKFTSLPEGLFKDLVNLEDLDLLNNALVSLTNRLFSPLLSLKRLYLHSSKISFREQNGNAQENCFQGLVKL